MNIKNNASQNFAGKIKKEKESCYDSSKTLNLNYPSTTRNYLSKRNLGPLNNSNEFLSPRNNRAFFT